MAAITDSSSKCCLEGCNKIPNFKAALLTVRFYE